MFTSKKAQYINKDFDKISPITNIDSLYYEQAEQVGDSIIINRKSVAKNMPINFILHGTQDISAAEITWPNELIIDENIHLINDQLINPGHIDDQLINPNLIDNIININDQGKVNINYSKTEFNPKNPLNENKPVYDYPLYSIDVSKYIELPTVLSYYTPISYFSSSIGTVYSKLTEVNSSISNISTYIDNVSKGPVKDWKDTVYVDYKINSSVDASLNNRIYGLKYICYDDSIAYIKIQCVSTNQIKDVVCLENMYIENRPYVDKWDVQMDTALNNITYLKDEFGNEANFDFRAKIGRNSKMVFGIANTYYGSSDILKKLSDSPKNNYQIQNNKIFVDSSNCVQFIVPPDEQVSNVYILNNQIYNSSNITLYIGGSSELNNNIIINSSMANIGTTSGEMYTNNFIINSSNYQLNIAGSNNTIINCVNCSINIGGSNNYIVNLNGIAVNLGNSNYIVGDQYNNGTVSNSSILNNERLFFNNSVKTAYTYNDLSTNATIYGGIGNDVSVYSAGIMTTDK